MPDPCTVPRRRLRPRTIIIMTADPADTVPADTASDRAPDPVAE